MKKLIPILLASWALISCSRSSHLKTMLGQKPDSTFLNEAGLLGAWTSTDLTTVASSNQSSSRTYYIFTDDHALTVGKICSTPSASGQPANTYVKAMAGARYGRNEIEVLGPAAEAAGTCSIELPKTAEPMQYFLINNEYLILENAGVVHYLYRESLDLTPWGLENALALKQRVKVENVIQIVDGPTLPTQDINDLKVIGDRIYIATDYGLYFSDDKGSRWQELPFYGVIRRQRERMARRIQVFGERIVIVAKYGLWISEDKGISWRESVPLSHIDPRISGMVLVKDQLYVGTREGLFASQDFGQTWKAIGESRFINDLATDGSKLYVASFDGLGSLIVGDQALEYRRIDFGQETGKDFQGVFFKDGVLYVSVLNRVFSSENGTTWTQQVDGIDSHTPFITFDSKPYIVRSNQDVWTAVPEDALALGLKSLLQQETLGIRAIDKLGGSYYVATNNGIAWKEAGAGTWQMLRPKHPFAGRGAHRVLVSGSYVYAFAQNEGEPEELYVSKDKGANWQKAAFDSKPKTYFKAFEGTLVAMTDDSLHIFDAGSDTWVEWKAPGYVLVSVALDDKTIAVFAKYGNFFYDRISKVWSNRESNHPCNIEYDQRESFIQDKRVMFDSHCHSTNKGLSWDYVREPSPAEIIVSPRKFFIEDGRLHAIGIGGVYQYSNDNLSGWQTYQQLMTSYQVDHYHRGVVVGLKDRQWANPKLMISFDKGQTEVEISLRAFFDQGTEFTGTISGDGETMFISTDQGLYRLTLLP